MAQSYPLGLEKSLLLLWRLLCPAGRRAAALDLQPDRQKDQAHAEGRVGDHPGTFARCRGRVDPEYDLDFMKGNLMIIDFDELMKQEEMYIENHRKADEWYTEILRQRAFPTPSPCGSLTNRWGLRICSIRDGTVGSF